MARERRVGRLVNGEAGREDGDAPVLEVPLPHAASPDRPPRLLLRRPFLWLVLGDGWAQLGRWAFFLAVVGDATYRLDATASQVGLLIGLFSAPLILVSPFYGVIADARSAKWLLVVTSIAAAPIPLIGLSTSSIGWLYAATILFGAAHAALLPSRGALVPRLVDRRQLVQANGMISAGTSVQMVIGPAVGALLVATAGPRAPYLVTMVALPLAALCYLLLPDRRRSEDAERQGGPFSNVVAGFAEAWRSRALRTVLAIDISVWFLIGLLLSLEPSYLRHELGMGQTFLAILWTVYGVGELIGSLLLARRPTGAGRELILASRGLLLAAVGFLLYATIPIWWAALLANVIFGIGFPFFVASGGALIQRVARHPGKVTATFSMVGELGAVLSAVTLAVAGRAVEVRPWLIGAGVVFTFVAIAASRVAVRLAAAER